MKSWNRNVLLLALSQALMLSGMSMILTTAALTGSNLSPEEWLSTLPVAALFIAMMLTSIPAAWLMARLGRKLGFILASGFAIAGAGIATLAIINGHFWLFILGTTLIGIYTGFGNYFRFAATEVVDDRHRNSAVSLVLTGGVLSALIGPNLANWTRDVFIPAPFAGSYAALTGLYCLSFIVLVFIRFPSAAVDKDVTIHSRGRSFGEIATQPVFIVTLICGMFGYGVMNLLMTAIPLAMHHHAHSFSDAAFVIQWHVLGMFAPAFFTGYLISRFGILRILTVGAMLGLGCVGINLTGNSLWHYWAALLMLGVSWNFLFIGATILLTDSCLPQERHKMQAINDFAVFTTVAISALVSGPLQMQFGWQAVNLGVLPLLTVILGSLVWLKLKRRRTTSLIAGKTRYAEAEL